MSKTTALLLSLGAAAASIAVATAPARAQAPAPAQPAAAQPASCPALLHHTFKRLQDEAPQDLCQYAGKVVLVVNTASYCGYTKQYEGPGKAVRQVRRARPGGAGLPVERLQAGRWADAKKIADSATTPTA
jgi:glutathione peroxidase